ncbi:MAG TPA: hypothetical protein VJ884_07505, partial [Salinibacter sp.]|nr:hypothetical protein [Salinibacter sp.]
MNTLFAALQPFIRFVVRRAGWVIALALLLSAAGFYQAQNLSVDTDFANLLPDDHPTVQALERLRNTVGGESEVAVGIVSPSFEANKEFAETLIPRALEMTGNGADEPYLTRVEYRRDVEFLKDNALYFASDQELATVEQFLDNQIDEAKKKANPFFVDIGDGDEDGGEEDEGDEVELQRMYDRLVGTEYPI